MIKTKALTKYFDDFLAVDDIRLNINKGVFFGLLGPNGAGKTTTLKMLSMLLHPSQGEIFIDNIEITRNNKIVKACIGVVPQHISLQRELTVEETLIHHGLLHKMSLKTIKDRIENLTHFAQLDKQVHKQVSKLSGGNKRKLMIIRSMMHQPKILFLDEPTVGLDPSIRRDIWDLLKKLKTDGLTIIITTHYIEEANQLCDEIAMMSQGKIIKIASPKTYLKEISNYVLEAFDGVKTTYHYFDTNEQAADYAKTINADIHIRKTNLEDVYISYTNERVM